MSIGIFLQKQLLTMDNESIKNNIFRRRNEEGLSQHEMARRIGVVRNTYRSIEKGNLTLISAHVDEIAKVFGISTEELVLGYRPVNGNGQLKELTRDFEDKKREISDRYEKTLARLNEKIAAQEKEIKDLREMLESKNEIIALLKRDRTRE